MRSWMCMSGLAHTESVCNFRGFWLIISTKLLDMHKCTATIMKLRARFVVREIAQDKRDDVFAATPPLESLRTILSERASHQESCDPNENFVIMSNDVSRA